MDVHTHTNKIRQAINVKEAEFAKLFLAPRNGTKARSNGNGWHIMAHYLQKI